MAYKYLKASPSLNLTTKQIFVNDFQALLNEQFALASDVWTVAEESTFASQVYENVEVRIVTHVVNSTTGKYLPDDYKQILFKDLAHAAGLGYLYQFDSNYWIVTNSEKIKNLAAGVIVKRCNNQLKWIDENGAYHSEPCSLDYTIARNKDLVTSAEFVVEPMGVIQVVCQYNDRTNLIRPNQRFLFGNENNWTSYKLMGGGIGNYQNTETVDNTTVGFITLSMEVNYISDNDDLINGIANESKLEYVLSLGQTGISGIIGTTGIQIYPTVTLNGENVTRTVDWSSSDTGIAIIGPTGIASGQTGIPSLLSLGTTGTAIVTGSLEGNTGIHAHVNVTVSSSSSDIYQVVINPNQNYILEGDTQVYTVYLYRNGVVQSNVFNFSLEDNTVPSTKYTYTATDGANTFSVKNIGKFLTDHLDITCTAVAIGSVPPTSESGIQEVNLRGIW